MQSGEWGRCLCQASLPGLQANKPKVSRPSNKLARFTTSLCYSTLLVAMPRSCTLQHQKKGGSLEGTRDRHNEKGLQVEV